MQSVPVDITRWRSIKRRSVSKTVATKSSLTSVGVRPNPELGHENDMYMT